MKDKFSKETAIGLIQTIVEKFSLTAEDLLAIDTHENVSEEYNTKDYTILEFRAVPKSARVSDRIIRLIGEDKYIIPEENLEDKSCHLTERDMLYIGECVQSGDWEIYKVRRNSDGVEWILGDIVIATITGKKEIVQKFVVDGDWLGCMYAETDTKSQYSITSIPVPEKKKEPILITEDGVEVYDENQQLYGVAKNDTLDEIEWWAMYCKKDHEHIWFSTKEARQSHIEENTPRYTLKDVEAAWKDGRATIGGHNVWDNYKHNKLDIR